MRTTQAATSAAAPADGFVARHAPYDERAIGAREQAERVMDEHGTDLVRLVFADLHGVLRGKTLTRRAYEGALEQGYRVPATLLAKDTAHRTIYPVFRRDASVDADIADVADVVMVPDPTTFRKLPHRERTAWVLSDVHHTDGRPAALDPRGLLRRMVEQLADRGYDALMGLEVEFTVFRTTATHLTPADATQPATPPDVALTTAGYQLMSEQRLDQVDEVVRLIADTCATLDLPLRSIEQEYGPSQLEVTFAPLPAMEAADAMVLFRSVVKQVARDVGYHVSFMCRPAQANLFSSGWHLHQSLRHHHDATNAFARPAEDGGPPGDTPLSPVGRAWLGGILAHASAASVFTTPTVNGYKRYQPFSLAPERLVWGVDNRGALARVIGAPGDPATRIENRGGEPAANPYLYLASQIASGLDGLERGLDPGPATTEPYNDQAERLPRTLLDAIDALAHDPLFRSRFGDTFIDHLVATKRSELGRYLGAVTDWEHREYFDLF